MRNLKKNLKKYFSDIGLKEGDSGQCKENESGMVERNSEFFSKFLIDDKGKEILKALLPDKEYKGFFSALLQSTRKRLKGIF